MYVIFPLDELLDLNSARENKRGRAALEKQSHTRHTAEVISLSQPNQQLPNQLKPPLSKQPQTPQQLTPSQQQQKQPSPSQKSTLTKTPSKTSIIVSPPPQPPASVLSSSNSSLQVGNVKKTPTVKQTVQQQQQQQQQQHHQQPSPLPPLDPVHKRQRSSHSTSTETSSTSSTGAKGKALLSPQAPGGVATNRSSWSGSPAGPLQESCPTRTGSFRAFKDLAVTSDGSSLKFVDLHRAESSQDIHGSLLSVKTPVTKSNSFRSHLSDNRAHLPRQKGVEALKKPQASPTSLTPEPPSSSSEGPRKLQETTEHPLPLPEAKAPEAVAPKEGTPSNTDKEKQTTGEEAIKIKQEVPVLSSPPSHQQQHQQQLTAAESLRIQQECLAASSSPDSRALLSNQRQPSGRSKHSSGSQKLSDIPPSGIGGGPRGAAGSVSPGSTNPKNQGSSGSLRGLHQRNTVMASNESSFRDLTNPAVNESLKAHNAFTFKLVKTVSDFTAQLSRIHEQHAEEIQRLVESFRKKNSELRNERTACSNHMFDVWESLLQEVEVDSQIHADVAGTLNRRISRPLIEKTFYRKIQSRKVFTHRESFDTILAKTEDMLNKCRRDYADAYHAHYRTQTNASLAAYFDAHNAYVQQLHATNGMLQEYNRNTLPSLLEELETIYIDVSSILADCILSGALTVSNKALEQSRRYETLSASCRSSESRPDVVSLVRSLETGQGGQTPLHRFAPPQLPPPGEGPDGEVLQQESPPPPPLKDELVLDRLAALTSRNRHEALKKEAADLERQISQLQDAQETLLKIQHRSIESSLFNKANELQEDISLKRFDLRVAQVHLSAVKAQKELFASKDSGGAEGRERKMSNSSGGSMKTKWMKAFKSLKTSEPSSGSKKKESAAMFETAHIFQEYTYKKITACDVCHQILRGHSRQGLKCRMCKTNVHVECQEQVAKCQPKSRLLRRQRSTSEIESKQMEAGDEDTTPNITFSSLIASQPTRRGAELPAPPSAATEIQIGVEEP